MKTITFKYTKKAGPVSERTLLVMIAPSDKYAGIDLSEISPEEAAAFVQEAEELNLKYISAMQALQAEFDLKHAYRQFLVSGMSEITQI
jgi:hypothetical protein